MFGMTHPKSHKIVIKESFSTSGYTTIVICPFEALKKDMLHRLRNVKISIQVVIACKIQVFLGSIKIDLKHHKSDLWIVPKRFCEVVF